MKRRLVIVLVFVLIGVLTTIAVAWACALFVNPFVNQSETASRGVGAGSWVLCRHQRLGVTRFDSIRYPSTSFGATPTPPESWIPAWCDLDRPLDAYTSPTATSECRTIILCGWPMRSMWCETSRGVTDSARENTRLELLGAWPSPLPPWKDPPRLPEDRNIPLRVSLPGFSINAIGFAAILYIVLIVPRDIQRVLRRWRGLCPRCGYNLRYDYSQGCPECSWQRKAAAES